MEKLASMRIKTRARLRMSKKIVILPKFTNNEFADVCVDGDGELKLKNDYRWTGICNIRNLVKIK